MQTAKWILKRMDFPGDIVLSGREEYSIGRGKNNYETVLSLLVSRLHCVFRITENGLTIKDLNSSNGTFVNERRIPANTDFIVNVGDLIGIGVSNGKASDHFIYRLGKEGNEDRNNSVCLNLENDLDRRKNKYSSVEISHVQAPEEDEDENDELQIVEKEVDIIEILDDEEDHIIAAGRTSKATSSTSGTSRTVSVDSGLPSSFIAEGRKTVRIKKEKCDGDFEDNELGFDSSVSYDVINVRENDSRLKDIKIEPSEETGASLNQHSNITSDTSQSVVKVEKLFSSKGTSENNTRNSCASFQGDSSVSGANGENPRRNTPGTKIKEKHITLIRNTCENNTSRVNKEKQVPYDENSGSSKSADLQTSSISAGAVVVKQEDVEDIRGSRLSDNVNEHVKQKNYNCSEKEKTCLSSSSRRESGQKIPVKRSHEDLPGVNINEFSGSASKKRKSSDVSRDPACTSSVGSLHNAQSEVSSSSSQSRPDAEDDNLDKWFKQFSRPFLNELEKSDGSKSVKLSSSATNVTGNTQTILLRRNENGEIEKLPLRFNPVVIVERLDLNTVPETIKINNIPIKSEMDITVDDFLFEEAMQVLTSTPKQGEFQLNNQTLNNSHSQCASINYSQSDDVIVIDDDDDDGDDYIKGGTSNKEDCNNININEEIFVKQEIFDDDDEQVIVDDDDNDDDDVELVNDWVIRLSQSSSPIIEEEEEVRPPVSGKAKRRSLFVLDSGSSDEETSSNLEQNVNHTRSNVERHDITNKTVDSCADKITKELFEDSSMDQSNKDHKRSSVSQKLMTNIIKDVSKTKNKKVDINIQLVPTFQTDNDTHSENESDVSQLSLSAYAEKLLDNALLTNETKEKKKASKTNSAENNGTKELSENIKLSANSHSSRRTLMCSALPMKSKYRSKVTTESRNQKKNTDFNSEVTKHNTIKESNIPNLTLGKTSSSEHISKSTSQTRSTRPASEKELKRKVKEDRKAKLKALTEQKADAHSKKTESKGQSKPSYLVKNTALSRADKLAESLVDSVQPQSSNSRKIKVKVVAKSTTEKSSRSKSVSSEDKLSLGDKSVTKFNPVASQATAPKPSAIVDGGGSDNRTDENPVSEVERKIKKLSFKDVYKIPKVNKSCISGQMKDCKPSNVPQKKMHSTSLRNVSATYPKKKVHFAPDESICTVQTFIIEPGNTLRRMEGKDIPLRKRLAQQAEVLYDTSERAINRVTTAILRNWNPRWMSEEKVILRTGGEPPPAHCQNTPVAALCPMLTAFSNYEEYLKIIDPLMMLDLWAKVSDEFSKPNQRAKRKYDLSVSEVTNASGIVTLNCSMPLKSYDELCPHVGDLCILRYPIWNNINPGEMHLVTGSQQDKFCERFAYVHSVTKDFRSTNNRNQWNSTGNVRPTPSSGTMNLVIKMKGDSSLRVTCASLKIISGIRAELRLFEAIAFLEHAKLCKMVLNPCVADYKLPHVNSSMQLVSQDPLNSAQRTAVIQGAAVCTNSSPKICLIQGPPGTGKTKVILNIIKQVLYPNGQYTKASFDKKIRILLCAPSNAAADEMAERLLNLRSEMPKENRFKMVRTGPIESMRENVRGISLDELVKKDIEASMQASLQVPLESVEIEILTLEARKRSYLMVCEAAAAKNESTDMYEKRIQETEKRIADLKLPSKKTVPFQKTSDKERETRKKILGFADIIVTTLSSSFSTQMTEVFASRNGRSNLRFTCCIIDEATQCTEPESLIPLLLGIERIVLVGDPEQLPATVLSQVAKTKSFGQSLFNRIWNKFQNEEDNPVIFLNTQYRMHPDIYHWPNTYIYHGRVLTDPTCYFNYPLKPYCLFLHRFQQNSNSFVNSNEVRLVCDIAMTVAHTFSEYVKTIGIITPYQQQLQEIKSCLERSRTSSVTIVVNTIDGFQGRECDVIIFSCVRTRGVGFMSESQRLNVAITRARLSLIVCGNFVSLQDDKMWSSLLGDAMQRRVIINILDRILNHHDIVKYLVKYA